MLDVRKVFKQISGASQWSDPLPVQNDKFSISVWKESGTFNATITIQKRHSEPESTEWRNVRDFTAEYEGIGDNGDNAEYRIGCSVWTSGVINLRLGTGF